MSTCTTDKSATNDARTQALLPKTGRCVPSFGIIDTDTAAAEVMHEGYHDDDTSERGTELAPNT